MSRKKPKPNTNDLVQKQYDFSNPNAPTLISIVEARGYVEGNTLIVSQRTASMIEFLRDVQASPAELRALADVVENAEKIEAQQRPSQVQATA